MIDLALETDGNNAEALQTLASVRLSQQRPDEARQYLERAWNGWKNLDLGAYSNVRTSPSQQLTAPYAASILWCTLLIVMGNLYRVDDPQVPPIPVRLSLVKLFLELSLFNPALLTLQGIMASDDQEVEAWYLEGWAFYLMAELAHDSPNGKLEGEGLYWEELVKDARDCLETCRYVSVPNMVFSARLLLTDAIQLHIAQEHGDGPILEHVDELIESLEKKGIIPTPEDEQDDGEWEDVDAYSDDGDGDVEMS